MKKQNGFLLLSVVWMLLLLGSAAAILQMELLSGFGIAADSETRLHSRVLADNGLEIGRSLLASAEISNLLAGPNGTIDCSGAAAFRNPVDLETAAITPLDSLAIACDDGLPGPGWFQGYRSSDGGSILLRFSNNPGEPPAEDSDRIVVLRSMGISPAKPAPWAPSRFLNHVSLVEALLRQERPFEAGAALVLAGAGAGLHLADGRINGASHACTAVVDLGSGGLWTEVNASLMAAGTMELLGQGELVADYTAQVTTNSAFRSLLTALQGGDVAAVLARFIGPASVNSPRPGITYLPEGGVLAGRQRGLFLTSGTLAVSDQAEISGMLVHIGPGALRFGSAVTVNGTVWLINHPSTDGAGEVEIHSSPGLNLTYDSEAAEEARGQIRPSVLNWRILFPEP